MHNQSLLAVTLARCFSLAETQRHTPVPFTMRLRVRWLLITRSAEPRIPIAPDW